MKKILLVLLLVLLLTSCAVKQPPQTEYRRIELEKTDRYIDICDRRAMPRFPNRPRLKSDDLRGLSTKQMDEKIQAQMRALNEHIDKLENVIVRTRDRVQECR